MPPKAKAAGKPRGPPKRKLAEEFPPGEVLTDMVKKSWKLGAPIGQGGFGLIYLADENSTKAVGVDAPYVIKVEPSESGPLFSELKFYMRAARPDQIESWTRSRKLKHLGVPKYWGSGQHERGGKKYRFMVMDRCGTDLQKKFVQSGGRFPRKVVLQLGLRLLDILEYIHEHEYVHADIKASNLVLSYRDPNQMYLLDYGLAYRYCPEGVLKEYKEDPKRCHDGTIEFTSIDAHKGVSPGRRGDMEILAYCMVQWLCGRLPWEDKLQDPVYVRDSKIRSWDNISEFMSKCFPAQDKPDELQKFMEAAKSLGFKDKPPYDALRSILQAGLKATGAKDDGKLEFGAPPPPLNGAPPTSPAKKAVKRKKTSDKMEDAGDGSPVKKRAPPKRKTSDEADETHRAPAKKKRAPKKKMATSDEEDETDRSPAKKKRAPKKKMATSDEEDETDRSPAKKKRAPKKKMATSSEDDEDETDRAPIKKKKVLKQKEVNVVKKTDSPKKVSSPKKRAASKSTLAETGTQTTPGLKANKPRGRTKKTSS